MNQHNKHQMWKSSELESGLVCSFYHQAFHISSQTFHEFNHYVVVMVNSLWNSRMFKPDMDLKLSEELLLKSRVPQHWTSFDLIHHPAFMSYAIDFHQKVSVDRFGWFRDIWVASYLLQPKIDIGNRPFFSLPPLQAFLCWCQGALKQGKVIMSLTLSLVPDWGVSDIEGNGRCMKKHTRPNYVVRLLVKKYPQKMKEL